LFQRTPKQTSLQFSELMHHKNAQLKANNDVNWWSQKGRRQSGKTKKAFVF